MIIKKTYTVVAASLAAATMLFSVSCNSGAKKGVDSDTVAAAVEETALPDTTAKAKLATYTAEFFKAETNKGTVAGDSVYMTTPSGLKYVEVVKGTGAKPGASDNVTVHYTGRLLDGTVFDSSVERGEPATFPLNAVIPGWTEGLQLMQEGGTTVFYIPSELAYGEQGTPGGPIPPNSDLIFEVELLQVGGAQPR